MQMCITYTKWNQIVTPFSNLFENKGCLVVVCNKSSIEKRV